MQVTSGIQCNLLSPSYSTIYAPQGDAQSRFVLIQLLEGATPWEVPAGASVIIRAAKPDGTFCFYDTNEAEESAYSVSGSTVTIELVGQVLAAPGPVLMQVDFYNADGAHLSTFTFCCQVSESVVSDEDIVSSDYFSVLTATLTEMQQIEQAVKAAYGAPLVAATAAAMTDHTRVYVYTGSESGYINGNWYYWNGSAWASGGVYNGTAVNVDAAPTEGSTNPVSSGGVYTALANEAAAREAADTALSDDVDDLENAINRVVDTDADDVDLDVADITGNVIARFSDGHIATKNFDSRDLQQVENNLANVESLVSEQVDFANSGLHFYVGSNGAINNSANWNAVVVRDATRIKYVSGMLGTNSPSNLCVGFYYTNGLSAESFISGLAPDVGKMFTVEVPAGTECIAICSRPASYADYFANIIYNVADIANNNTVKLSTIEKYTTGETLSVQFEQGTISSSDGTESANANRIRTVGFINTSEFSYATCDDNHKMWLYEYDRDYGFVKGTASGTIQRIDFSTLDADTAFIRIVITNLNGATAILPTDVTGFVCVADMIGQTIVREIDSAELVVKMGAYPRPLFTVQDARIGSDNTIIGTKFVKFNSSSDDLSTTAGNLSYREYANGFDKAPTSGEIWINHYFGHCNSVDYCAENDCLILGNGSGDYSLPGKIYIIPNFTSVLANAQTDVALTLQNTNAIVIDCSSYDLGSKFNVIWGEKNGALNNIAYLITATFGKTTADKDAGDIGVIRRLLLGMGSNQLEYGQFISGQSGDEFNGTFAILDTYTQDGTAYKDCCQGSCYYKGEIVCAIGHGKPILWRMNLADGKIRRKVYEQSIYAGDGSVSSSGASGACTDGERVFTGVVDVGVWALNL